MRLRIVVTCASLLGACSRQAPSSLGVGFAERLVPSARPENPSRQVAVLTWWPTPRDTANAITIGHYVAAETLTTGAGGLDSARARLQSLMSSASGVPVSKAHVDSLLSVPRRGVVTAPAPQALLPTVIIATGFNAPAYMNATLAERLACSGMLVVAVPTGAHAGRAMAFDSAGAQGALDDLRSVKSALLRWSEVDTTRLILAAWSVGGLAAALLAEEVPRAKALVSLDAATGYAYGDTLLARLAPREWKSTVPYLQLESTESSRVARSRAFLRRRCDAPSTLVTVGGLAHRHFTSVWGGWAADSSTQDADARIVAWESFVTSWIASQAGFLPAPEVPSPFLTLTSPVSC